MATQMQITRLVKQIQKYPLPQEYCFLFVCSFASLHLPPLPSHSKLQKEPTAFAWEHLIKKTRQKSITHL